LQIETYDIRDAGGGNTSGRLIHCASCQIKVFKVKKMSSLALIYPKGMYTLRTPRNSASENVSMRK
jgi:hypothetical protein